ncbi:MAG: hypothetical protein FJ399_23895 [Verrucomicrobia bacterium]|nr:hypothetical protein [Verrucomicrobiota bacterium]
MARSAPTNGNASSAAIGFEAKLWLAAAKLRSNMDAAEYNFSHPAPSPPCATRCCRNCCAGS